LEVNRNGTYTDEWGITYKFTGLFLGIIGHPLADVSCESLEDYHWPDPYSPGRIDGLEERAKKLHEEGKFAIVAKDVVSGGPLEYGCWLRGMEQFMIDMVVNKQFARELITGVETVILGLLEVLLDAVGEYVDIIQTSEDLGSQSGLLISPQLYREMLKPTRVRINNLIKSLAPHAKVFYHCCGAIYELIPDIIETGIDILNPIQPRAFGMDSTRLKKEFGSRLCFHGGIDVQQTLPRGSPRDVEHEVRERIGQMGKGGGYIVAPANIIQSDTPPINVVSMCEAVRKWGKYPLGVDQLDRGEVNREYT
jgi:uroporphyrinogen decarboxylase